jgi:Na+/H+ antiporter NhaA
VGEFSTAERWSFLVRTAVTGILLVAGLYILINGTYPDSTVKWAIGALGLVAGYWLR